MTSPRRFAAGSGLMVVVATCAAPPVFGAETAPRRGAGAPGATDVEQGPGDVSVTIRALPCMTAPDTEIRRMIAVELGARLIAPDGPASQETDLVTIDCVGPLARITIVAADDGRRAERAISITDFPADAAARVLSLVTLETLATLDGEADPPFSTAAPMPTSSVVVAAPPTPPARQTEVAISAVHRTFTGPGGIAAWGGRITVTRTATRELESWGRARRWSFGGDLEVVGARRDLSVGQVGATAASLGGFAGIRWGDSTFGGSIDPGARVGLVMMTGAPRSGVDGSGDRVFRPWCGPALRATVHTGGSQLGLQLAVEGGVAVIGARGIVAASGPGGEVADSAVVAVSGAWIAVSVAGTLQSGR